MKRSSLKPLPTTPKRPSRRLRALPAELPASLESTVVGDRPAADGAASATREGADIADGLGKEAGWSFSHFMQGFDEGDSPSYIVAERISRARPPTYQDDFAWAKSLSTADGLRCIEDILHQPDPGGKTLIQRLAAGLHRQMQVRKSVMDLEAIETLMPSAGAGACSSGGGLRGRAQRQVCFKRRRSARVRKTRSL